MTNRDAKILAIQTALAEEQANYFQLSRELFFTRERINNYGTQLKKYGIDREMP